VDEDGSNAQYEARNIGRGEMKKELYLASFVLLFTSGIMAYGWQRDKIVGMQMGQLSTGDSDQATLSPSVQHPQDAQPRIEMQQTMPEQHHGMEHRQMQPPGNTALHAQDLPVPDLLVEAKADPAMKLEDLENLALTNNPTLRQAQAVARTSAGLSRQAGLWPNPSVGYLGEQIRGGSFHGGEQGGFVQQNIVLGGKLHLRQQVYEQQRKVDEIGVEQQRLNITGATRVQFYKALALLRTVEIRRQLMQVAMDAAMTAYQLANVGQADVPDVLQSEIEAERAKLSFAAAQRQYIQDFRQLAALVGNPDLPLALLDGDLEKTPEIDADHLLQTLVQQSPSVKRAQQEVSRAEAVLKRNKREAVPDLNLRAGEQQNFEDLPGTSKSVGAQSFATATIQIPLFNRNQGNVDAAKAELERDQQEVSRVKLALAQSAQPLLQQYLTTKLEAERYRTQMIPRAQRAYELYLHKYQSMAAAYPEVIISQRTLFQLQESYVQSLGELWTSAVQLQNYLLADGISAPSAGGSRSMEINLPTSGSGNPE
jgi:cobalt-zinc-cadmium efflux system outer membrane protein